MNKLAIALGAVLLAALVLVANLWLSLRNERAQGRQLAAAAEAPSTAPVQAQPLQQPVAAQEQAPAAAPAANGPPATPNRGTGENLEGLIGGLRESMRTEAGQEFMRTIAEASLRQRYPDLAKALGISQADADKLIQLLAEQGARQTASAIDLSPDAAQDPVARQELARQMNEAQRANEAEVRALLGDAHPKWQEYQRTTAERQRENQRLQQQNQLRAAIDFRDNPLSDAQFKSLTDALEAERQRFNQESRGQQPLDQMQRLADEHRRQLEVARVYLNAGQLERYERHLSQQADMARTIMGVAGAAQGQ